MVGVGGLVGWSPPYATSLRNGTYWILVCVGMRGFWVAILVFCFRGNDGIKEVEIMKQKRDGAAIWACAGDKCQVV